MKERSVPVFAAFHGPFSVIALIMPALPGA